MEPIIVVLALVIIGYTVGSVKIINQGNEALVERLGRYNKKLTPGLNFVVPFLDTIVWEASTREQLLDVEPQEAFTKDNVSVLVDAAVYWRILQLERTYYAIEDVEESLTTLVTTALRSQVGQMDLARTFSSRNEINQALLHQLDDATATWGVKVTRIEVQKITPAKAVADALELERASKSRKEAAIAEAQGRKAAAIAEAEGRKQAAIQEAEGTVESIRRIVEVLKNQSGGDISSQEVLKYLVAQRYVDANFRLGQSPNSKIIFMDPKALNEAMSDLISPDLPAERGDPRQPPNPSGNGGNGGNSNQGN